MNYEPESRPLPRGRCPECGTDVALRKDDLVREHRPPARLQHRLGAGVCPGSGQKAVAS